MNPPFKLLMIALTLNIWTVNATAHLSLNPQNVPTNAWEQHSEGIALTMTLITQREKVDQKSFINIYIKNTSNTIKEHIVSGRYEGVQIFYINSNGSQIPLHEYNQQNITRVFPVIITPGETLLVTIDITSEEMALLKAHPVKYKMLIYDPTTKQQSVIESSPKVVTETVINTVGK